MLKENVVYEPLVVQFEIGAHGGGYVLKSAPSNVRIVAEALSAPGVQAFIRFRIGDQRATYRCVGAKHEFIDLELEDIGPAY